MDKYFRLEQGGRVNIIEHTLEQINKWPNLKIYIGTDSQDCKVHKNKVTRYATVIVYRYGDRGAHYIWFEETVPRIKILYTRLFDEAVRTIETADMLSQELPAVKIEALEFDYNHIPKFKSHQLISAVKGWVLGLDYTPVFKSGEMIACKAGDHICRHKNKQNAVGPGIS